MTTEQKIAEQIQNSVSNRTEQSNIEVTITDDTILIPSGSKRLNLACSDTSRGAYLLGRYANLIGDSSAGKSFLALSMLAEMSLLPAFDNYRFIYDDAEEASSFNVQHLFGKALATRIESPAIAKDKSPVHSDTIQDFNLHVFDAFDNGKPFIYILDSFDSLTSKAEIETTDNNLAALRKGTKAAGSFGMDKPKIIGQILRMITSKLKETKSFILIISQTRDNINPMSFSKKTRSGGNALKFYASHEIWLASIGKINKTVNKQARIIGGDVRAKVTKNKLTGKVREVDFSIFYEYGIDDIGSCIDFLTDTGTWELRKKTIIATHCGIEATREKLIASIEEQELENTLFALTETTWRAIEESVKPKRKSKFNR